MQLLLRLSLWVLLAFSPVLALAHSCPLEMYKIDRALSQNPKLDAATLKKIRISARKEKSCIGKISTAKQCWFSDPPKNF